MLSGGPLIRPTKHDESGKTVVSREVVGVVSGGWFSSDLTCDYGTFYATLGEKTQALIANGLKWTDPCADITLAGSCDGTVATRCTGKWEGDRRVSQIDCASLGLTCSTASGRAVCVDADGNGSASVATGIAPTVSDLRVSMARASRGWMRSTAKDVPWPKTAK
jgi:hypothetical protein